MELPRFDGFKCLRTEDFHRTPGTMSIERTLSGLVAFAGGVFAGFLLAPQSGAETRAKLSEEGRARLKGIEDQLESLESRLGELGGQVRAKGNQVKNSAVGQVLPDLPDDPEAFKVGDDDVAGDLRHMPRK